MAQLERYGCHSAGVNEQAWMDYLNRAVRVETRTFETNRTLEDEVRASLERPSKMRLKSYASLEGSL